MARTNVTSTKNSIERLSKTFAKRTTDIDGRVTTEFTTTLYTQQDRSPVATETQDTKTKKKELDITTPDTDKTRTS